VNLVPFYAATKNAAAAAGFAHVAARQCLRRSQNFFIINLFFWLRQKKRLMMKKF